MSRSYASKITGKLDKNSQNDPLKQFLREGVQQLIADALHEEITRYVLDNAHRRTAENLPAVVRNGYHPERLIRTSFGEIKVKIPKVRSRDTRKAIFHSELFRPYARPSKTINTALPQTFLRGVSTGNMADTLSALAGKNRYLNLNPKVGERLEKKWQDNHKILWINSLHDECYVRLWKRAIRRSLRGKKKNLSMLVLCGLTDKGEKHFLAIKDNCLDNETSWDDISGILTRRGLKIPDTASCDEVLVFNAALEELFPMTAAQRR